MRFIHSHRIIFFPLPTKSALAPQSPVTTGLKKLIPAEAVETGFYTPGEDRQADRQVVDAALPWLDASDYSLVLIHLDQVDYAGHYEGGPRDPNWAQAARRSDDLIAEIASHLDLNQDTLMVFSDHGQIDTGGHGGQDPIVLLEPFVMAGAGVIPGQYADIQMTDVAPTAALLLGTNLPAAAQGRPLAEMLAIDDEQLQTLRKAYITQQAGLLNAYTAAIGQPSEVITQKLLNLTAIKAAYQSALQASQAARMRTERMLRAGLAVPLVLVMVFLLWKIPRARLWWLLVSGMVYVLLFNLRYVLLDGRTYSLSSVTDPADLIIYTGITASLSLLAASLVSDYGVLNRRARSPIYRCRTGDPTGPGYHGSSAPAGIVEFYPEWRLDQLDSARVCQQFYRPALPGTNLICMPERLPAGRCDSPLRTNRILANPPHRPNPPHWRADLNGRFPKSPDSWRRHDFQGARRCLPWK